MKRLLATLMMLSCLTMLGQEVAHIKMKSMSKPIIQAEINGKKGYFLVDTGADISVINSSLLKKYDLEERKIYGNSRTAVGFNGGRANVMKVKNANVLIGQFFDHKDFYSINLDGVSKSIQAKTNLTIVGIIGADLLMKYNCIIDYNQRHITMVSSRASKRLASN
ncbi:MAG: retropepsin-like aspartic protease [Bacteroidota bacterium]